MKVYLDNGATTKVDINVANAVKKIMIDCYGNPSSIHSKGEEANKILIYSRETIAREINCLPEELYFTSGGTEANNIAIFGLANKKHIITSAIEHPSVLETCKHLQKNGFNITFVKPRTNGIISVNDIEKEITPETGLITIMHANNEIGTIQPIKEIGKICKEKKIIFHVDAVQSFLKEKIDVADMDIDALSISAHKIHGPKGVGALYVKKGINLKKRIFGGHQEKEIRPGTENLPGIYGFAIAAKEKIQIKKIKELRDRLISRILNEIPDSFLNGDKEKRLCNNVNISFRYIEGEGLLTHLDIKGICVSTGSACSSKSLSPSHVLLAIGLKHEEAHGSIRFTLSKNNTKKEIDYTVDELKKIVKKLREMSPLK